MVKPRVLLLSPQNIGPYHMARFRAFHEVWPEMEVVPLPTSEHARPWTVGRDAEIPVRWLFGKGALSPRARRSALGRARDHILRARPAAMVAFAYRDSVRRCLRSVDGSDTAVVLYFVSTYEDKARRFWREWAKRWLLKSFDAVAATGERSVRYAQLLGVPRERVWRIGNVVDNEHFASGAKEARRRAAEHRRSLGLPERYFLCVGRLSPEKNLDTLIGSFARYRRAGGTWQLVLVGAGPEEDRLRELAGKQAPEAVHFVGWKQYPELPLYYGLASCFVLASVSETWGLVVNEAMASGLPVLVSRQCGCVPELCQQGVNGYDFDPADVQGLAQLMHSISSDGLNLGRMGEASRRIIANFTPRTWARALAQCLETTIERKRAKRRQ